LRGVDSVGVENCRFPLTKPAAVNTVLALWCVCILIYILLCMNMWGCIKRLFTK